MTGPYSLPRSVRILSTARRGPTYVQKPSWGMTYESPAEARRASTKGVVGARRMKICRGQPIEGPNGPPYKTTTGAHRVRARLGLLINAQLVLAA